MGQRMDLYPAHWTLHDLLVPRGRLPPQTRVTASTIDSAIVVSGVEVLALPHGVALRRWLVSTPMIVVLPMVALLYGDKHPRSGRCLTACSALPEAMYATRPGGQ